MPLLQRWRAFCATGYRYAAPTALRRWRRERSGGVRPTRAQKHPDASGRTFVRIPAEECFCARGRAHSDGAPQGRHFRVAERGCASRSSSDGEEDEEFCGVHSAQAPAAGETPALRQRSSATASGAAVERTVRSRTPATLERTAERSLAALWLGIIVVSLILQKHCFVPFVVSKPNRRLILDTTSAHIKPQTIGNGHAVRNPLVIPTLVFMLRDVRRIWDRRQILRHKISQ